MPQLGGGVLEEVPQLLLLGRERGVGGARLAQPEGVLVAPREEARHQQVERRRERARRRRSRMERMDGGPLCFEITSRTEAYIRRAFVIDPTVGGGGAAGGVWRLVLDIVPRPSGASAAGQAQPPVRALAALPPLHGMETPDPSRALEDREPLSDDARGGAAVAASPPEVVEVSWARASRILRELQDRQSRDADAPLPPQLVLPEKYRQSTVPLR